jgi:hypothetical protein
MNYVITIILVLLVGWLLWVWVLPADVTPDVTTDRSTSTLDDFASPSGTNDQAEAQGRLNALRAYQSPILFEDATTSWSFTMQLPEDTDVNVVSDSVVEFTYAGPTAEPNTELTDGYTMIIEIFPTSTIERYLGDVDALGKIATQTIGNLTARTYQTEGEGDVRVTHYVIPLLTSANATGTAFADVAVIITGDGQYESSVQRSLETLRFAQR